MEKETPKKFSASKPVRRKKPVKKEIEDTDKISVEETTETLKKKVSVEGEEITDLEVAKKMMKIFQSAMDRSLEFNLSFVTVKKLLSYKTCYYTSRTFEEDGPYARSFDRVDSSKGYVEGNVIACTVDINGKKSNLTVDEIIALYNRLAPTKIIVADNEHVKREDHGGDLDRSTQTGDSEASA